MLFIYFKCEQKVEQIRIKPHKEGRKFNAILIVFMSPKIYHAQVVN